MTRPRALRQRRTSNLAASLLAAFLLAGPYPAEAAGEPAPPAAGRPVVVMTVERPAAVVPGTIVPRRSVDLGAPVESVLRTVLVVEGDRVVAGDAIAVMDDRVARARVEAARHAAVSIGTVQRVAAELARARWHLERTEEARAADAVSTLEHAEARSEVEIAEATLVEAEESRRAAELELALAEAQLDRLTIRAPFAGRVTATLAEPGASLQSGDPVVRLETVSTLEATLHLPAEAVPRLTIGTRYALEVESGTPLVLAAELVFIEPRIDPTSGTVRVVLHLDERPDPDPRVLIGGLVRPATSLPAGGSVARGPAGREPAAPDRGTGIAAADGRR